MIETNIWILNNVLQIGPKCLSIQEQVDPIEPFNEHYVTFNHETYVTASGDYYNDTVNIGASVELKCFYGPSMTYLYCIQNYVPPTGIPWFTLLMWGHIKKTRKQKPRKSRLLM